MKQQPTVTVKIPEELMRQVLYLCEKEHRSPQAQILMQLRNSVAYFERAKGKMDKARLQGYDLTPYLPAQDEQQ